MADNLPALLYVASGILFILALRGLSSPETAREGNRFGIIGMGIAVFTTLFVLQDKGFSTWFFIVAAVAAGAMPGAYIARKIPMTAMPQLVAAFHSLVGLAAVFIAWAAFLAPERLWHRRAGSHSYSIDCGDVTRRRHRRDYLFRLGHRFCEAERQHVRGANSLADAASDQSRAGLFHLAHDRNAYDI